jgi:hypothetical protein
MLLLESITNLLETKRLAGFHTTLQKIKAHTDIRGNDLADAATKLAARNFDTLSLAQTTRVDIGKIAPDPTYWVMYMAPPLRHNPALSDVINIATLCRRWWTIPEADHLQMHTFTCPSQQLQLTILKALLRSLHHFSMYKHLILANKEK